MARTVIPSASAATLVSEDQCDANVVIENTGDDVIRIGQIDLPIAQWVPVQPGGRVRRETSVPLYGQAEGADSEASVVFLPKGDEIL